MSLVWMRAGAFFSALCLALAAPAFAETDPMLAGAAFAKSDLSPLTGVTVLRFVPGVGLERYPLDRPPSDAGEDSSSPVSTTDPASASDPINQLSLRADAETLADEPIQVWARDALGQVVHLTVPQASRYYVFIATGDRQLGYNFGLSAASGWSAQGLTFERSRVRSQVRAGLAWQGGPYSALLSFTQLKARVIVPWLPSVTDDRIEVTFIHQDK